ncbi:2-octaprenyl-6-methoxyphenol 4-monooxygenase [Synechococcus sp. RSCCF101]|uniref:FAD-dependent monooxygenase n=1 Tax=Synechococcus sp. RSCCF101 TaxID=2511069 RepID=UPI001247BC0B|nr:FAD-dependent monooxygenase [Synechococcus sp. RSCCF101]QEY31866.1 2-octaprenyl-6-methoxyphenol 4-monooxygenase [Synechococcus sp. RSCCF101]
MGRNRQHSTATSRELRARVIGAGPTGALAALALADAGWIVELRDRLDPSALLARERAYAISQSSRILLQQLGLWAGLRPNLSPFQRLQLEDRAAARHVLFGLDDLPAEAAAIGWILGHRPLMALLLERLSAAASVSLQLGVDGPFESPGPAPDLVLACDGPRSGLRRQARLPWWEHRYGQSCVTATVALSQGHGAPTSGCAWECFRPEGPLAVLPLERGWAQVVWSCGKERAERLTDLSPSAFLDALAAVLPGGLEPEGLRDQPRAFPVGIGLAPRLSRGRMLLVGEAAHRCHPVGGQGLNLCWRDVATIHRLAALARAGRLRAAAIPSRYALRRRLDLLLTLLSTDLLVRLFSNRQPLLLPLRRLALALLRQQSALRRLALAMMELGLPGLLPGRRDLQHHAPAHAASGPAALSAAASGHQRQRLAAGDAAGRP